MWLVALKAWLPAALLAWLLAALIAWPGAARAQSRADDPLSPARVEPKALDQAYRRAQARRNVGIGLAAPGVALAILGSVLVAYGANNPNLYGAGEQIGGGATGGVVGLAIGIPGIVLWIMGQDDMDVVSWRRRQLSPP